jgi:hypothetical protein
MKRSFLIVAGVAVVGLVASFPHAQEDPARVKSPTGQNSSEGTTQTPDVNQREPDAVDGEEVKIFRLKQADASESRDLVLAMYPAEFMNRSKIAADIRTNVLVIRGTRDFLATIEAVLVNLDDIKAAERTIGNRAANGHPAADPTRGFPTQSGMARDSWPSLQMAADSDSEVRRVQQEYRQLEQKAADLAGQYWQSQATAAGKGASAADDPASAKLKTALEGTVQAAFDARQKIQSYELEQLRQRLSRIESRLTMRDRVKGEIVRQRVEELLHPERSWEPGEEAGDSPSAVDPSAGAAKKDAPWPRDAATRQAQDVWMTDVAAARAGATKAGRLLLLYFRPKPSTSRQQQELDMAGSPSVQKVLRHFVLVAIDTSDAANQQLMEEYRISDKPKVVVTDAGGQPQYTTERDPFRDRWNMDELRQDLTGLVQRYLSEQAESAKDEVGRPALISSDSARSAKDGAAVFPADGKNPREAVLDADFGLVSALAAVAAAEKGRDFSKSDLQRTQQLYEKGAVSDKAVRTAERQVSDDDARLEKTKLDLQHAERLAKLARENLDSRVKLLELDMVDAKLRIEHLEAEEARGRRLLESKAMSKAEYDESKLGVERARLQLSRLKELMELYAKPIPGGERPTIGDDGAAPEPPPKKKTATRR